MKEAAFIVAYTYGKLWQDYEGISKEAKRTIVPRVLMIECWDGLMGFPGGLLEEGESPWDGAKRELQEEIGFCVDSKHCGEWVAPYLIIHTTHESSRCKIHSFLLELSPEDFDTVLSSSRGGAKHFGTEVLGVVGVPLINYEHAAVFDRFMKRDFAPFVKEDIECVRKLLKLSGVIE